MRICGRLYAAIFLLLPGLVAAETWPVKDFEVFIGKRGGFFGDTEMTPTQPMTVEVKADIEAYLSHVADLMEDMGFKAPYLEPIIETDDGRRAFRVYYFDYTKATHGTDAPAVRVASNCGNASPSVWINGLKFLDGGQLDPKDYQDLAHELFHGVQDRYPMFAENCSDGPGNWIAEGTAQAVGADVAAYSIRRIDYPHRTEGSWAAHRWGLRTYDMPLFVGINPDAARRQQAYADSSFWRYLGEQVALHGGAGTAAVRPDYSYLIDFFNTVPEKPIDEGGSMVWLDQQLRNTDGKFKLGLNQTYANFITTFAAYGGTRVNPPAYTPAENHDRWLNNVFLKFKCPRFSLDENNTGFLSSLAIAPVAAECFRADWPRAMSQDVQVRVFGQLKERLQALELGTGGGAVVADPILVQDGEGWNATWIINIPAGTDPAEIIISNVAANPRYTRAFEGSIDFRLAAHRNNLVPTSTTAAASQSAPSGPSAITSAIQAGRVAAQINRGLDELNPNMAHGGTVVRRPDQSSCEDAFVDIPCGPTTTISLEYVPGMMGSLMQSTGRGGAFGQFSSTMSGVAASDAFMSGDKMKAAAERSKNTPGSHVSITIPLIDYGFTGTFNNAYMMVNAGPNQTYKSIGPADIQPGPGRRYPFAGVVTIEEYTPWQLRGSYSGHLTNVDRLNLVGDNPSMPIHENILGTFNIIAPWHKDDRMIVESAETAIASVIADMQQMQSAQTAGVGAATGGTQPGTSPFSSGGRGGSIGAICDCSCNSRIEKSAECETQCAPTIAACAGNQATAQDILYVPPSIAASEVSTEPFLRSIPSACDVMDETSAMSLLAATAVEPSGPREWMPKVTSQCGYRSVANRKANTELTMLFMSLALVDSYTMPREELRIKAGGFALLTGAKLIDVEGVGNISFALIGDKTVTLKVFTGIYGTAADSDQLVSELALTYTLTDSGQAESDTMKKLYDASRAQVELLKRKALSTHEGE